MKKIIIGSDKSGYSLKEAIKKYLISENYKVEDCGTKDPENAMAFYEVAPFLAKQIQEGEYGLGILICGTGAGMAIVANKHKGISAVACESVYSAEKCRAINNANIMTMGGWIVAPELAIEMTEKFISTEFTENLEDWRADNLRIAQEKISSIEENTCK